MIPKEFSTTKNLYKIFEDAMDCLPPELPADAELIKNKGNRQ